MLCTQEKGGLFFHSEAAHAPHLDSALTAIVCKHKGAKHAAHRRSLGPGAAKGLQRALSTPLYMTFTNTNYISTANISICISISGGGARNRHFYKL